MLKWIHKFHSWLYPEITHVAILIGDKLHVLPRPNRHHHIYRSLPETEEQDYWMLDAVEEGFVDAKGNFLNRTEATKRAIKTKQLNRRPGDQYYQGPDLYSEDLW